MPTRSRLIFVALLLATAPLSLAKGPERPNIILLLTDDQRADTLGAAGNPYIETPHLDSLARRGVLFRNAFVTTSICATSRASILTGQYARRHGIWNFSTELSEAQLADSYLGRLRAAGYYLGFIGKWGVASPPRDYFDFDRIFAGQGHYFHEVGGEQRHLTSIMGDQLESFLQELPKDRPFALSVSFKAAHVQDSYDLTEDPFPFDPDLSSLYTTLREELLPPVGAEFFPRLPRFLKNSEGRMRWAVRFWGPARTYESIRGYYRLISGVDRVVGRLLRQLEEQGLIDSTVILFSSDNGFFLGEYGLAGKWTAHEPSIRVPLILYHPSLEKERSGGTREEMVLNLDLAPTILDAAGLEIPETMQGSSLLPLLEDGDVEWRDSFFYEHLFDHARIPKTEALRTDRWKYVRYRETRPVYEELYDLVRDPLEIDNLAGDPDHEAVRLRLESRLFQMRREAAGP